MNKVTLYIKDRKFLNALLRNSIFIPSDKDIEEIPTYILKHLLSKHNIEYSQDFTPSTSDIIVTDDISIAKDIFDKKILFLPPIDFNVIDGFVNELRRLKGENLNVNFNTLKYLEINHPNLVFLSPSLINHPNIIFDLSLILNYNLYDLKWGAVHYSSKDLFKAIVNKPYRIDYSVREVKKLKRIKLLLDLINLDKKDNLKITIHNSFIEDYKLYELANNFFYQNGCGEYFEKIIDLDSKYYSLDKLENNNFLYQEWPINKLMHHTLMSDIACYFESAPEGNEIVTMDYLITEKTIDLLSIGKPFIYNNTIVKEFLENFGFIDYNKSTFKSISADNVELIKKVSEMPEGEYRQLRSKLMEDSHKNLTKLEDYLLKNTLLERLIHN